MTRNILCGKCRHGALIEKESKEDRVILLALCRAYTKGCYDLVVVQPCVECPQFEPMGVDE